MADLTYDVAAGGVKRLDDMGDGTHAEVIRAVMGGDGIDAGNSTTTPLSGGATFTGTAAQNDSPDIMVTCKTDAAGTLYVDLSADGVNYDTQIPYTVAASSGEFHIVVKGPRYHRVRFVNGSDAQTYLRLATYTGTFRQANSGLASTVQHDADAITVRAITEERFIAEGRYEGRYIVQKFGRNSDVDGAEDIWNGGGTYAGFPVITDSVGKSFEVFSSSTDDATGGTGARTMRALYLDGAGNLQSIDHAINGTTPVTLGVSGWRLQVAYVLTAGSVGTNVGNITYRHVSPDTANIFAFVPASFGRTRIAAYTVPAGYTGYMVQYTASMSDNTANTAEMAVWQRYNGAAFWIGHDFKISTEFAQPPKKPYGGIKLPALTDVKIACLGVQNANANISADMDLILVQN